MKGFRFSHLKGATQITVTIKESDSVTISGRKPYEAWRVGETYWSWMVRHYGADGVAKNTHITNYPGEYLMIDLGETISISEYTLFPDSSNVGKPKTFQLYGCGYSNCWQVSDQTSN